MIWHVINYTEFVESLNKSRRKKLVDFVTQSRRRECVPERAIQVMPLCVWVKSDNPAKDRRRDSGEIRAFIKIKDGVVFLIFDNLTKNPLPLGMGECQRRRTPCPRAVDHKEGRNTIRRL